MTKNERNAVICLLYKGGQTLEEVGKVVNLSKARVKQIVASFGLSPKDRRRTGNARREFLGVNLSAQVKAALLEEAIKRDKSMSELGSSFIEDLLRECGHAL